MNSANDWGLNLWEKKQRLVVDTSVCIDIFNGGILDEAVRLPYYYLLPDVIIAKLEEPPGTTFVNAGFISSGTSGEQIQLVSELSARYNALSVNDLFALAIAKREGMTLLTGDNKLRTAARREKVDVHGTLWVLDRLVEDSTISRPAAADALERIMAANSWLPAKECRERLARWKS